MKKRLISFVILLALCASLLCACGSDSYVPTGHLRLKGRDVEVDWVMKVDGEEISADEYRYFFMNTAFSYISDTEGEYEWTDEENLSVIATAEEYVVLNKALFDLAEGFGIVVTEADEAEIQKTISQTASGFSGREEYLSVLASNYITEEYYSTLLRSTVIQEKLSEYLTGVDGVYGLTEDEMVAIMQEEYVCVRYLMLNPDEEGKTDQKDRMAVYASAIKDKSDLITHINLYSEDVSMKNNAEGRYITPGLSDETLFNAVSQLEIGEISPVIEGEMGYYIAVRQPINLDYITENIDSFIQLYQEMKVKDLLMAESADCVVEYNDSVYKKISVWNME